MPVAKNTGSHRMRRSPSAASAAAKPANGLKRRRGAAPSRSPATARSAIAAPLAYRENSRFAADETGNPAPTKSWLLEKPCASFETHPYGVLLRMKFFLNAIKGLRHPEERCRRMPEARLEGRELPMQCQTEADAASLALDPPPDPA